MAGAANQCKQVITEFDSCQALTFLNRRFHTSEGIIAMGVDYQGRRFQPFYWDWPGDVERLLSTARRFCSTSNVYICPVLRKTEDLDKWNGLLGTSAYVDLDGSKVPEDLKPYLDTVESGTPGHYHGYLNLSEAVDPHALEVLNYALKSVTKGDNKWSNASYLRLPGTWNHKSTPPNPVRVVSQSDRFLSLEEAIQLLAHYLPDSSAVPRHPTDESASRLTKEPTPRNMTSNLINQLNEASKSDRSSQSYRFIMSCFEHGYSLGAVYSLALLHRPTKEKFGCRSMGVEKQVIYLHSKYQASSKLMNSADRWSLNG